jgi:hypothetical protein
MKTKKLMLGALIAAAAVSGAHAAGDNAETIRACKDKADKCVVVSLPSGGERAVPRSKQVCSDQRYEAYCSQIFADVQVGSVDAAEKLIRTYAEVNGLSGGARAFLDGPNPTGDDFIGYTFNKNYIVFQFDDISESFSDFADYELMRGYCLAKGGKAEKLNRDLSEQKVANAATVNAVVAPGTTVAAAQGTSLISIAKNTIAQLKAGDKYLECDGVKEATCASIPAASAYNSDISQCLLKIIKL